MLTKIGSTGCLGQLGDDDAWAGPEEEVEGAPATLEEWQRAQMQMSYGGRMLGVGSESP